MPSKSVSLCSLTLLLLCNLPAVAGVRQTPGPNPASPLKIGVAGLTHGHVNWVFGSAARGDVEITGIVEPDRAVARRYCEQYGYPLEKVYDNLDQLFAAGKPEAVAAFGNIYDHLAVVEACAPRGIHVMVEKPLAVSLGHARKMAALARQHGIWLLTNYETTWYPTNHLAYTLVKQDSAIGPIRRIEVQDGHRGPVKIGVQPEFLAWLTDPELNGGGSLTDFGCYGANLITWLMDGTRPLSVTALTGQLQPGNNPKVEDEAIILLAYPEAVGVIQASWNWPIGRKDLAVYGLSGVVYADNRHDLRIRMAEGYDGFREDARKLPEREPPLNDPFLFLEAVVRGRLVPGPVDLSSLENNLTVMEILDAARRSAREGRSIRLADPSERP